jgi:hypothetical protein
MEGFSGTVSFKEIEVKNRPFYRCWRYELIGRWFGWRMRLSFLPDFTMTKDFFDKGLFLDKRNYSHLATALWTFQRVNTSAGSVHRFVNALDERRPRHATFTTVCSIRFRHSGQRRHNRLFCLLCHPTLLSLRSAT